MPRYEFSAFITTSGANAQEAQASIERFLANAELALGEDVQISLDDSEPVEVDD